MEKIHDPVAVDLSEALRSRVGSSVDVVADRLNVSRGVASELLDGRVRVTPAIAGRIAVVLGGKADDYVQLEEDTLTLN